MTTTPQQRRENKRIFFDKYTSLLRVDSKIGPLVDYKQRTLFQEQAATLQDQKCSRNVRAGIAAAKSVQPAMTTHTSKKVIHHAFSAREQQVIGTARANKSSTRLMGPRMINGSNARLLENRFFKMQASPRGSQLTITTRDPKRTTKVLSQSPTMQAYMNYAESQQRLQTLKFDESAQQIQSTTVSGQWQHPSVAQTPIMKPGGEATPSKTRKLQLDIAAMARNDSDLSMRMLAEHSSQLSLTEATELGGKASPTVTKTKLPSIFSSKAGTEFDLASKRRASLPGAQPKDTASLNSFDMNCSMKMVQRQFPIFQQRSNSVMERHSNLSVTPRKNANNSSVAERKNNFVEKLSKQINQRSEIVKQNASLSKMARDMELRARQASVFDDDEIFQQKWSTGLQSGEINIQKAMKAIDAKPSFDRTVDINMQLSKAYKQKLSVASEFIINQMFDQSDELKTNIKVLAYQQELLHEQQTAKKQLKRPTKLKKEPSFAQIKQKYLVHEQKVQAEEKKERKRAKEAAQAQAELTAQQTQNSFKTKTADSDTFKTEDITDSESNQSLLSSLKDKADGATPKGDKDLTPIIRLKGRKSSIRIAATDRGADEESKTTRAPERRHHQLRIVEPNKEDFSSHVLELDKKVSQEMPELLGIHAPIISISQLDDKGSTDQSQKAGTEKSKSQKDGPPAGGKRSTLIQVERFAESEDSLSQKSLAKKSYEPKKKSHLLEVEVALEHKREAESRLSQKKNEILGQKLLGLKAGFKKNSQINLDFSIKHDVGGSETSSFASDFDGLDDIKESDQPISTPPSSDSDYLQNVSFSQKSVSNAVSLSLKNLSNHSISVSSSKRDTEDVDGGSDKPQKQKFKKKPTPWQEELKLHENKLLFQPAQLEVVLSNYFVEKDAISKFLSFCQKTDSDANPINGFPILHQLFYGRLVFKECDYGQKWIKLAEQIIKVLKNAEILIPLNFIYFEDCQVPDGQLAQIVTVFGQSQKLKEFHLVKMRISVQTTKAILLLLKNKAHQKQNDFMASFQQSIFLNFRKETQFQESAVQHPLLSSLLVPIINLSMAGQELTDVHLDLISRRLSQLKLLDISGNNFAPDRLQLFLRNISRVPEKDLKLRWLCLSNNNLQTSSQRVLSQIMIDLLLKASLVHLDLGWTELGTEVTRNILRVLKYTRTIQSLHLSAARGPSAVLIKQIAREEIGTFLFQRDNLAKSHDTVPSTWNQERKVPDPKRDEICSNLLQSITSKDSGDRIVISRILGRHKDIKLLLPTSVAKQDESGDKPSKVELHTLLDEEQEINRLQGLSTVEDYSWLLSNECWICDRHTYYLPIVTKNEIEDCMDDYGITKSRLEKLGPFGEKVFDGFLKLNKEVYQKVKVGVPYIVGELTCHRLLEMGTFGDYMISVDPEAHSTSGLSQIDKQALYCSGWQRVFKTSLLEATGKRKIKAPYSVAPYEVITERDPEESFDKYESVWAMPLLAKPGPCTYYIYYKFDDGKSILKAQITTQIPMRPVKTHYYPLAERMDIPESLLPTTRVKIDAQAQQKSLIDRFFTIFKNWGNFSFAKAQEFVLHIDIERWQALRKHPRIAEFINGNPGNSSKKLSFGGGSNISLDIQRFRTKLIFDQIERVLKDNLADLDSIYRHLQVQSDAYPLLDYETVSEFLKTVEFIDSDYTIVQLKKDYSETESKSKKAKPVLATHLGNALKRSINHHFIKVRIEMELPKNLLSRLHFYELITRISIVKYADQQAADCLKSFIKEHIKPALRYELRSALDPVQVLKELFFDNTEVKQLLFLNQYHLKSIYDKLHFDDPQNDRVALGNYIKEDVPPAVPDKIHHKQKYQSGILPPNNPRSSLAQDRLKLPVRRQIKRGSVIVRPQKVSDLQDTIPDIQVNDFSKPSRPSISVVKNEATRPELKPILEIPRKISVALPEPAIFKQQSAMMSTQNDKLQVRPTFRRQRSKSFLNVPSLNLSPMLRLRRDSNASSMNEKASPASESGNSRSSLKSTLKKKAHRKHRVKQAKSQLSMLSNVIKMAQLAKKRKNQESVTFNEDCTQISFEHLFTSLQQAISPIVSRNWSPKTFKLCYVQAKLAAPLLPSALRLIREPGTDKASPVSILSLLHAEKKVQTRINFVEITVMICLLTWQLYGLPNPTIHKKLNKAQVKLQSYEALKSFLTSILGAYKLKLETDFNEKTLATMQSDFRNNAGSGGTIISDTDSSSIYDYFNEGYDPALLKEALLDETSSEEDSDESQDSSY